MNCDINLRIEERDSHIELHLSIPDDAPNCIAATLGKRLLEIGLAMLNQGTGQNAKIIEHTTQ